MWGYHSAIEAFGLKIFHAGDFNNGIGAKNLPRRRARGAEHDYLEKLKVLADLYPPSTSLCFRWTLGWAAHSPEGAEQFIGAIHTKTFAPMHFALEPERKMVNGLRRCETKGALPFHLAQRRENFEL